MYLSFSIMANHPSYDRMMQAAQRLKGITTPSELAKSMQMSGLNILAQHLNNYRKRGISKDIILDVAAWLGCNPFWLRDGTGEMKSVAYGITRQQAVVLKAMESMPTEDQDRMVKISNTFTEPEDNGDTGPKAAQQ